MKEITKWLSDNGFGEVDDSLDSYIGLWLGWYRGKVSSFHNYTQYNGREKIKRCRKSMGMAKAVSEDWANLLLNEKVTINISAEKAQKTINNVLLNNRFWSSGNQLIEKAFALGTGAFVEFLSGQDVLIDYISADMIYPISWENGEITECAFASQQRKGEKIRTYLNIHKLDSNGFYVIYNRMFEGLAKANGETQMVEISLPEGMEEEWHSGSVMPLFQIVRPNVVNNIQMSSPKGISIFANAIDQMEGIDLVYDSYCNEFRLGKKRIVIPLSFAQVQMEKDGTVQPLFDSNDTEFYAAQLDGEGANKLQEINMELRSSAHEEALKTALNAFSMKCGMGSNRYRFESDTVKTATEVISAKSVLFQNIKKHEILLREVIEKMISAIAFLSGIKEEFEIEINFDDSIIEDTAAERMRDMQEVREGLMQKWEYRVKWYGEDEETAKSMVDTGSPLDIFAD